MSSKALDLYAKVEDLLGVQEVAPRLYKEYFEILKEIEFDTLLDIGCGAGEFLSIIDSINICSYTLGIDRSALMVQKAQEKGVNAKVLELQEINEEFDLATATFDMINYLAPKELEEFFSDLSCVLKKEGYFIFDVNSYYGLSELAVGNFIAQDERRFVTIESFFEENKYKSYFTLFEQNDKGCYQKETWQIDQYYYSAKFFENIKGWKLLKVIDIDLYETNNCDKHLIVMQKV